MTKSVTNQKPKRSDSDSLFGYLNGLTQARPLPHHPMTEAFRASPEALERAVTGVFTAAADGLTRAADRFKRMAARRSQLASFYLSPHAVYDNPDDLAASSLSSRAAYKGAYTSRLRECNRASYALMEALDAACGIPVMMTEVLTAAAKARNVPVSPWAEGFSVAAGLLGIAATLCSVAARVPVILERGAEMRRADALKEALDLGGALSRNTVNGDSHVSLSVAEWKIAQEDLARRRLFHELMGRYFAPATGAVRVIRSVAQLGAVGQGPLKWGLLLVGAMLSRTGRGCEIVCGEVERVYTRDFAASPAGEAGALTGEGGRASSVSSGGVMLPVRQAAAAEYGEVAAVAARQRGISDPQALAAETLRRVKPPRLGESPALLMEKAERAVRLTPLRMAELRRVAQDPSEEEVRAAVFLAVSLAKQATDARTLPAVSRELKDARTL